MCNVYAMGRLGVGLTEDHIQQILVAIARVEEQLKSLSKAVDDLSSFRDWAIRLVIGSVMLGLMGLLYAQSR